MSAEIYLPTSNTNLKINVADDTVIEAAEKLEMMARLLRKLADGDIDENGNVNIDGSVEHTDIRFEHEEWDGEFRVDSPLIASVIISVFKNGRSKSNVRFCKDFADWAKTGKAFAEFGRKSKDEFPISALKEG